LGFATVTFFFLFFLFFFFLFFFVVSITLNLLLRLVTFDVPSHNVRNKPYEERYKTLLLAIDNYNPSSISFLFFPSFLYFIFFLPLLLFCFFLIG
jgi:hypothetical protein